jgi:CrcB protein
MLKLKAMGFASQTIRSSELMTPTSRARSRGLFLGVDHSMVAIILVGIGSSLGGVLRYLVSVWVYRVLDSPWFPYGTLTVNVLGCLVIGFLAGLAESRAAFTSELRLFIFVGVLGGFTTFSSSALETFSLLRATEQVSALVNVGLQLLLGLLAVWVGNILAHAIGG